jgi:hypothetical protein
MTTGHALPAKAWQQRLNHALCAQHIDLKHCLPILGIRNAHLIVTHGETCVVDEGGDVTRGLGVGSYALDVGRVCDITDNNLAARLSGKFLEAISTPGNTNDGPASRAQQPNRRFANARASPSN